MAKRQTTTQVSATFHCLVKQMKADQEPEDIGFERHEFERIVERITDSTPIDFTNEAEVERIKNGENLPFLSHEALSSTTHFGCFEGAYYGHEYRNTRVGTIDADSLNLRRFYYLLDYRRDGKIVVGVQYTGNYGDYDGIKKCFQHLLNGNSYNVVSRTFSSIQHEIGDGEPVELKVNIRRQDRRVGAPGLFASGGMFAIKRADYGEDFGNDVRRTLGNITGSPAARKAALASLINNGELLEISDDDIEGCTLLMRQDTRQHTVYLLGGSHFATKFPLSAAVDINGIPHGAQVRSEMLRYLNDVVTPGLRR